MLLSAIILLGVAAVSLVVFAYPYLIYPRVLRALPKKYQVGTPGGPMVGSDGSRFVLIFSSYNEENSAPDKIANIRALKARYPELEIRAFDDGSTDKTVEIYGTHPGDILVTRGAGRQGKAHGMKALVALTTRDFIICTDANVILDVGVVDALETHFTDPDVGGVCGHLRYTSRENSSTEKVGGAYWAIDEELKRAESETGSVMGGDGSIFAIRRSLYPEFPDTVQDDFTVTMSAVFSGSRLTYAPDVIAYENLVASSKEEYRRKVRISARAFHTYLCMRSRVKRMSRFNRWKFSSHKIIRWFGAIPLALATIATSIALVLLFPVGGPITLALLILLALLSRRSLKVVGSVWEIALAVLATMHGVILALRGETFATWAPPKTR